MLITVPRLLQIVSIDFAQAQTIVAGINGAAPIYDITTPLRMCGFLSQAIHESQNFTKKSEGLNYSPAGLIATFSYFKKNPLMAQKYGRITGKHAADQAAIANAVYADINRDSTRKLGNTGFGDGFFYRGFGYLQATGANIALAYAAFKNMPVKDLVNLCRTNESYAIDCAMWVFTKYKSLLDEADKGDIIKMSTAIAGSEMGLKERETIYNKCKSVLIG